MPRGSKKESTAVKVTYATAAQSEEFHRQYDEAIKVVKGKLGKTYPNYIGGQKRHSTEGEFADISPVDTQIILGHFQKGTRQDAQAAIEAAGEAFPRWSTTPYKQRIKLLRKAADIISKNKFELAALMSLEVGKNRLEAMGDVEESADLIRYYCDQMEANDGFDRPMEQLSPAEKTRSVLKPYGVWAVISPFNFPLALAAGPAGGALVAGNTVVFKPSSDTPLIGLKLYEILTEAGLPDGVFNYVTGSGNTVGAELVENPKVAGLTFTGSYDVGFNIYRQFSQSYARPCITELGGKNPAIVTAKADLDKAAEGIMRSAFGLGGQKCSACSRVYVERSVKDAFTELLLEKTKKIIIGNPLKRETFLGPLINEQAYRKYQAYVELARRDGQILFGGQILKDGDYAYGYYVTPTIVDNLPLFHRLFKEELFVPILCLASVDSLEEALELANSTDYGLTAGLYSEDEYEIQIFLDRIFAGVIYVNRRAGATTGAWPGVQPFGGWKASGSTGKASGGLYYVQQYLREQSQTIVE